MIWLRRNLALSFAILLFPIHGFTADLPLVMSGRYCQELISEVNRVELSSRGRTKEGNDEPLLNAVIRKFKLTLPRGERGTKDDFTAQAG